MQDVEEGEGSSDVEGEDAPSVNTDNTDNDGGKRQRGPSTAGAANSKRQRSEGNVMSNSSEALAMLAHAAAEPKKPGQQKQQKQQQKQQQQQANQMMTEMWNAQAAAAAAVAAAGGLGVGLADLGSGEVEGALPEDINIEGLDDKDLKRLRRKQSNRESARRSRLRKQAECETLQRENKDLKAQLQQLREENMKLNAQLELLNVKFSMTVSPTFVYQLRSYNFKRILCLFIVCWAFVFVCAECIWIFAASHLCCRCLARHQWKQRCCTSSSSKCRPNQG